jgi:hypothetical protein
MTVIKIYPEKNFTTLHNDNIWDTNLPNETLGFWVRCVSMKSDWEFYVVDIAKRMKCGKNVAYKHIKLLQEHRYCMRFDCYEKAEKGRFSKKIVKYVFFQRPFEEVERQSLEEELKKFLRNPQNGDLRFGPLTKKNTLSQSISLKAIEENSDINKQEGVAESLPLPTEKKKKPPKYKLSQEEKDLLAKMLELTPPVGPPLEASFITAMFKAHGYERVKKSFEFCASKNITSSLGGLLRKAIENEWQLPDDEFKENKRLCEEFASNCPKRVNITQTYLTCPEMGLDISFSRPTEHVLEQLEKISKKLNMKENYRPEPPCYDLGEFEL